MFLSLIAAANRAGTTTTVIEQLIDRGLITGPLVPESELPLLRELSTLKLGDPAGVISLVRASELTGVPYPLISKLVARGVVRAYPSPSGHGPRIHADDLPAIRRAYYDDPDAIDPTPNEIKERCAEALRRREDEPGNEKSGTVREYLRRRRCISIAEAAELFEVSENRASRILRDLAADGVLRCVSRFPVEYSLPAVEEAPANPDAILRRMRKRARRHVRQQSIAA